MPFVNPERSASSPAGRRGRLWWGAALGLALAAALTLAQRYGRDPHGQKDRCQSCHFDPPRVGLTPPAPGGPRPARGSYPLRYERERAVCERCHIEHSRQTHPTEIVPRLRVPAGWPLDAKGRLMCSSCHDPHAVAGAGAAGRGKHLLRGEKRGVDFCQQCHGKASRGDSRSWHMAVVRSAHSDTVSVGRATAGTLDRLSTRCLSCHDGTSGPAIGVAAGGSHGRGSSHPVGVRYAPGLAGRRRGRRPIKLRSVAGLDKRIRLFDGKVGCGSCHNLYARSKKFLAIETRRGRLCLACHDM